jgi:hypothetical protein
MSHNTTIKLEVKEEQDYKQRSTNRFVKLIAICIVIAVVAGVYGTRGTPLGLGPSFTIMVIFLVLWFLLSNDPLNTRYFLLSFELVDDKVTIEYKDKMEPKKITGRKSDFTADIKSNWLPSRSNFTRYFVIKYKEDVILKQIYSTWKDEKIKDQIIACLKKQA